MTSQTVTKAVDGPTVYSTPESEWIDSLAYRYVKELGFGILAVWFQDGSAKLYQGVPTWLYAQLVRGRNTRAGKRNSVGSVFAQQIKGKFQSQEVDPKQLRALFGQSTRRKAMKLKLVK